MALTKVTDVDEIKDFFKRTTAWMINRLRGKLAASLPAIEEKAETVTLDRDTNLIDDPFGMNQIIGERTPLKRTRRQSFYQPKNIEGWIPTFFRR